MTGYSHNPAIGIQTCLDNDFGFEAADDLPGINDIRELLPP